MRNMNAGPIALELNQKAEYGTKVFCPMCYVQMVRIAVFLGNLMFL